MWSNISPTKSLKSASSSEVRYDQESSKNSQSKQALIKKEAQSTNHHNQLSSQDDEDRNNCGGHSPLMRYKHAVCSAPCGYIYVFGGRFGNLPLDDDVWRFDPHQNSWLQLTTTGARPPSLQEHTLVEFNEQLYLFGGQVSASQNENSFWRLDLVENKWFSLSMKSSRKFGAYLGPTNRRGHSAVIHQNSMFIYGGFEDFRGSSNQLWEYHLLNEQWELRNLSTTSACHPEPRHSHSAVVFEDSMFVYGGLSNLKPLSDLWRWSWRDKRWYKERTRGQNPGQLHGHTAIQAFGSMFVFGGERGNGRITRGLWRLNLSNMTWQKIRPKGPRPNPTTWHGAIANPLSILDEANYIIEGDSEMMYRLKNNSLSDNCFNSSVDGNQTIPMLTQQLEGPITVSNVDGRRPISVSMNEILSVTPPQTLASVQQQRSTTKRRSRLSFLRSRTTRPRSTYELKQLDSALKTTNGTNMRHSISTTPSTVLNTQQVKQEPMEMDDEYLPKANILDNLDSDIKNMFEHALDTNNGTKTTFSNNEDAIPMDQVTENPTTSISNTSKSHYGTALQASDSMSQLESSQIRVSQRTSYAYTTPPSELNNLTSLVNRQQDDTGIVVPPVAAPRTYALLSSTPGEKGFNRRDNRPKSEIVQSLIDRADARIKHLYTPYFNQESRNSTNSNNNGKILSDNKLHRFSDGEAQQKAGYDHSTVTEENANSGTNKIRNRQSRYSLDRSKRHTIHQTMTYYNLYFSDHDKSSNSPPDDNEQEKQLPSDYEVSESQKNGDGFEHDRHRMVRDDNSSSTIKGDVSDRLTTSGVLVGVHGVGRSSSSSLSTNRTIDQQSQLSLEATSTTTNSSETKTLCGELFNRTPNDSATPPAANTSNSNTHNGQLSTANALTARRDTGDSCDNTSLSFSVIAEFEEDDMLQYSSPTEPIISIHRRTGNSSPESPSSHEQERDSVEENQRGNYPSSFKEPQADELQMASYRESIRQINSQFDGRPIANQSDSKAVSLNKTQNSSSSGYESISGVLEHSHGCSPSNSKLARESLHQHEQAPVSEIGTSECSLHQQHPSNTSHSDTQEESSVRTESSFDFTTTETSPEQSALKCKKMKVRPPTLYKRLKQFQSSKLKQNNMTATSSTTADSLALVSDGGFELSPTSSAPATQEGTLLHSQTNLPSTEPRQEKLTQSSLANQNQSMQTIPVNINNNQTVQSRNSPPSMSRTAAKFFGKQKAKTRYWQLCMFVIGGKQGGAHGLNEPMTVWRLYI